jgi:chromate transport protein ChrA
MMSHTDRPVKRNLRLGSRLDLPFEARSGYRDAAGMCLQGHVREDAMAGSTPSPDRREKWVECWVLAVAIGIALCSARPYAGGWNDGSRLATVETLIDRHAWFIDDSIFVRVPHPDDANTPLPYDPNVSALLEHGTLDKLFIHGHYYSDKSPVPALLMAGEYQLWKWATSWTARTHPDRFCAAMTLASSGLSYVLAVLCIYRLGRPLRLPLLLRLALTGSFALATVALPYAQQVNNHILLLAVTAALVLELAWLMAESQRGSMSAWRLAAVGTLAGLGYTIDLGTGPVILLCTTVLIAACRKKTLLRSVANQDSAGTRSGERAPLLGFWSSGLIFALAALPWLVLHHALNYAIGGSFQPANAHAEYFVWPGSPFAVRNLTGSWAHDGPLTFLIYAASMLGGKRGFLGHNLPLFLTLPALIVLLRRHRESWPGALWALGCCGGTWLLYAATSNNSSGQCCSIRWFVPLLAPAYYLLALFLRRYPEYRLDFLVLSAWGVILVFLMREGPWITHMVRFFWPIQTAALCSWAIGQRLRSGAGEPLHAEDVSKRRHRAMNPVALLRPPSNCT